MNDEVVKSLLGSYAAGASSEVNFRFISPRSERRNPPSWDDYYPDNLIPAAERYTWEFITKDAPEALEFEVLEY